MLWKLVTWSGSPLLSKVKNWKLSNLQKDFLPSFYQVIYFTLSEKCIPKSLSVQDISNNYWLCWLLIPLGTLSNPIYLERIEKIDIFWISTRCQYIFKSESQWLPFLIQIYVLMHLTLTTIMPLNSNSQVDRSGTELCRKFIMFMK